MNIQDLAITATGLPDATSRAEQAADRIGELAASVEVGALLGSKDELRNLCAVSVGTFNEALKLARARGVVTVRRGPGGGIFASAPGPIGRLVNNLLSIQDSRSVVDDALRMRRALDPLLLEDAVRYSTAADIADIREAIASIRAAMEAEDVAAYVRAGWRFQVRIADISPSTMLRAVFRSILELLKEHNVLWPPEDGRKHDVAAELLERYNSFVRMADALEARDLDAALQAMDDALTHMRDNGWIDENRSGASENW